MHTANHERYQANVKFIGPPVGWFGPFHKIMGHVSLMDRFVNETHYAEGLVSIRGIGERFVKKETT